MIYALDTNIISYILRNTKGVKQRNLIDDADILIAAQALTRGHILVTNNVKHFERVDGLQFVNWAE